MVCANNRVHYDPVAVLVCLHITLHHYHHYAVLSEGIELLKCLSDTFCLECVSKIKSILSVIFHVIYGAVCIQLTITLMMTVRMRVLIILLSSSNRKYDPFAIDWGLVMNQ